MLRLLIVSVILTLVSADFAHAQWGNIKGRVLLDGEAPIVRPLVPGPAPKMPGVANIPDESLVVDAKSKGIANILIWVARKPAEIHPDHLAPDTPSVTVNLTQGRFSPHIAVVRTDQTLEFVNLDPFAYNTRVSTRKNALYSQIIAPKDVPNRMQFKHAERVPVPVNDDIYPWMRGYLLIVDHPYATITDKNGNFEIKDLPAGEHEFKVWHEIAGYLVKHADNPKKGLVVNVQDSHMMVLDDIKIPLKAFDEPRK